MKSLPPKWFVATKPWQADGSVYDAGEIIKVRFDGKIGKATRLGTGVHITVRPKELIECDTKYEALNLSARYKRAYVFS